MRLSPLFSRAALALALGAVALTASPTMAQKKKKEKEAEAAAAAASTISPSKEYLPEARKVQAALATKDAVALETALVAADAVANTPQDKYLQLQFRLQLGLLKSDQTLQASALDGMIDSGLAPAADVGRFNFFSGQFAYNKKDYIKSATRFAAAKAAGHLDANLDLLLMDSYLQSGRLDDGLAVARAAVVAERAAGKRPSDDYYARSAKALQAAGRRDDLLAVLTMRVEDYPQPEIWRNTLFIAMQGADKDTTLDILRLMRSVGAMTARGEVQEYAALATEGGLPGEVLAVIDEARAKGIVPAKDARFDEIYASQKARTVGDKVALDADAAKGAALPTARRARSTADALFGYGDYAKAATIYQIALDKGDPETDLVMLRLGVSQHLGGDRDAAKATLGKVGGTRKPLASLWLIDIANKQAAAVPAAPATTGR
ncbi:MAG: tetratricopeptide repeat protein [Sphingopyxis sp.]|nr:tetratricopeptide repeat protein [Sphingopyxis sp.]